jgi:hypothetical protein
MVNRFETPAEAQFINYYTPIPFDDMMKVGLLKQARIDEDLANQEKVLTEYSSFATAPGADEKRRDEIINQMRNDIGSIQGQPGYAEWKQNFANLRSKYASDPEIMDLKRNAVQYATMAKSAQEAQENGITRANQSDLQNKMQDYYTYGRAGLRDKTGSGQLTPSSYYANVNTREELAKWSKDVKPSGKEFMYNDQTGKYNITQKNAGITLNAIGAPYGVQVNTVYEHGKPVVKIDKASFDRDGFRKIMNEPVGQQIARDAKQNLQDYGVPLTPENLDQEERSIALSHINSIMNERVTSDSSIKFAADDYAMADYKHAQTDIVQAFTNPLLMSGKGNTLTSASKVDEAKNTLTQGISDISKKVDAIKAAHGGDITEKTETFKDDNGKEFTRTFYTGADGKDATEEMVGAKNEEKALKDQMDEINRVETKIKNDLKLDSNYTPSPMAIDNAKKATAALMTLKMGPIEGGWNSPVTPLTEKEQKTYDEVYQKQLAKTDPKWASYESRLKEQAKAGLIQVGMTRFTSEKLNNEVEDMGLSLYSSNKGGLSGSTSNMAWAQDTEGNGGAFTPSDYKNINNALKPRFEGWAKDPADGSYKFIYKFQTAKSTKEKPQYTDPVKVDAPDGAAQMLIRQGAIQPAEEYLSRILSDEGLGVDKANAAVKMPGFEDKYSVSFEALSPSETQWSPQGTKYRITIPVIDNGKVIEERKYTVDKQDAITKIIAYYRSVDALKSKQSGPEIK